MTDGDGGSADLIGGEGDYDAFDNSVVSQGSEDNTTKITATEDSGNRLYYAISDNAVVAGYVYNTPIDVNGLKLTEVKSGRDISAKREQYLSVYEVDSSSNSLRKFICVKLDYSKFTSTTGGLVADNTKKIIYCNGARSPAFSATKE